MDAYAMEVWDRILPVSLSAVRGEIVTDYGIILAHCEPWALETW